MKWKNKLWWYLGIGLVLLFLAIQFFKGIIWFFIQTVIYGVLLMLLLFYLKRKGFFNSSSGEE